MADSISLNLNIENSLQQTLQETQKAMKSFNSLLEKAQSNFTKLDKSADSIVDHYDDIQVSQQKIVKSTGSWFTGLQKVGGVLKGMVAPFAAIFTAGNILESAKNTMTLDKNMRQLSFRLGEAGETAEQLKTAVFETAQATGMATDEAGGLVKILREMRVPTQVVGELATNVGRFSDITGISSESSGQLAGQLMRVGRLGVEATTNIMAGMVKVQRAVGMTTQEMEELSEGIVYSTKMLNQMGKSASAIEDFSKGVVKLAGAFTQVGLSAADANKFVEELLDPGRVEENAFLYAKLGVSLEEAFSGNVDPGLLASQFKDLGEELRGMSGPAASAMAKQLGMPLQQLRQMAEMDVSAIEEQFAGGASGAEELAAAQDQQLSAQEKLEKTMNRVQNTISELVNEAMPFIDKLVDGFADGIEKITKLGKIIKIAIIGALIMAPTLIGKMRQRFLSVATDTKQAINTAIVEGMSQGSRKGAEIMRENVSGGAVDRTARVAAGPQSAGMSGRAEEFEMMASGNLSKGARKMTMATAQTLQNLSAYAKPLSRMGVLTQERNKAMLETMKFAKQEHAVMKGIYQTRTDMAQDSISEISRRKAHLELLGKERRTAEQNYELRKLDKIERKANLEIQKSGKEIVLETERMRRREERALKAISEEQIRSIALENNEKKEALESSMSGYNNQLEALRKQENLLNENLKAHEGDYLVTQKLEEEQRKLTGLISEQNMNVSETRKEMAKLGIEHAKIARIAKDIKVQDVFNPDAVAKTQSIWRKTGRFITTSLAQAGLKFSEGFDKARNSVRQITKNLAERLKPSNLVAGVRQRFSAEGREAAKAKRAEGGGVGGALGGLMKIGGPILMIARLLGNLEPVQKAMKAIMDKIRPILTKIGERLAPIIQKFLDLFMPIIDTLAGILMPLVDTLMGVIGPILDATFPIIRKLVAFLLPPVIEALGFLLEVLGNLVKVIGGLVKTMVEFPITLSILLDRKSRREWKDKTTRERQLMVLEGVQQNAFAAALWNVGDGVATVGKNLISSGQELQGLEIDISDIPEKVAEGVSEGMSGEGSRSWTPAMIKATSEGILKESDIQENWTSRSANASEETASHTEAMASNTERMAENQEATVALLEENKEVQNFLLEAIRDLRSSSRSF